MYERLDDYKTGWLDPYLENWVSLEKASRAK